MLPCPKDFSVYILGTKIFSYITHITTIVISYLDRYIIEWFILKFYHLSQFYSYIFFPV